MSGETFAAQLRAAEERLRANGLSGRAAYAALCRNVAKRLGLPKSLWLEGVDAPAEAGLDRIGLTAELDLFGLAYERFFPEVFKAEHGQFFTPRPLVELMADLVQLRPGERVLDPTCGSGAFLVTAHGRGADVDGMEIDPELVALCRLNLKLHGCNPRAVQQADLFRSEETETWDVILANPPFSVEISHPDALRRFALTQGRKRVSSDVLFLEAAWRRLRPGGRLATVLPHSILANDSHAELRAWLDERFMRMAIISLPEGIFRPFGGTAARACVVCLRKQPAQVQPWWASLIQAPGYDTRRKVFRRNQPDHFGISRIQLRRDTQGGWPREAGPKKTQDGFVSQWFPPTETTWVPESLMSESGIGESVSTVALHDLAPVIPSSFLPQDHPDATFTVIDMADIDKRTGEVTHGAVKNGTELSGSKTRFQEWDLLFGKMRPNLNNVAIAARPNPDTPADLCGSSEWVRLRPNRDPYFTLIAARSMFVRQQLQSTDGQTRPRVKADDIGNVQVPLPGKTAQQKIQELMEKAHEERLRARQVMDKTAALYEAFGRGELDETALLAALQDLSAWFDEPKTD